MLRNVFKNENSCICLMIRKKFVILGDKFLPVTRLKNGYFCLILKILNEN